MAGTLSDADARCQEVVELFASHGAVLDASLAERIAEDSGGAVHADQVLKGLKEIPFHFSIDLWDQLAEQAAETLAPEPAPMPSTDADLARKEAIRRRAAAIFDGGARSLESADDEDDVVDDHDDELTIASRRAPEDAAQKAREFTVTARSDWRPVAAEHESQFEVVQDMTGNSTCEGKMSDFVDYFQDRYKQISKMLKQRRELRNAVEIERISAGAQEVAIIGMVVEKRITKNGHRMVQVEDSTGAVNVLVNKDETQLIAFADTLVNDEVIGVVAQASNKGDLLFSSSLIRPDIPSNPGEGGRSDAPVMAAFLSDIHVGSNTFLTENWESVLKWISGHGTTSRERDAAGRIKYLVIPGDLVDGVGIYPGQQDELTIGDVYDQYGAFGDWMKDLPDHLEVVIQPGNHDVSRPAEPQPAFTEEVRERFDHHNSHFVANPAYFKMHGVTTLGYHGSSLIDFATSVTHLEYEEPLPAMRQMLQSRHLAPLYGERTPVAPEHHDYLVINEVPDLFITGHVHVPGIENYRGVQMVNCGTWQSQTLYQKMLNFTPDPARMPLIDLQNLRGTLVDFQSPATNDA
jgi:DNA polymerase II small subunit